MLLFILIMAIIQTKCWVQKPVDGYFKNCFAIFGMEYQTWLIFILISLVAGFFGYYVFSLIRGTNFEVKNFVIKSLFVSLVILIVLLVFRIWWFSNIIY